MRLEMEVQRVFISMVAEVSKSCFFEVLIRSISNEAAHIRQTYSIFVELTNDCNLIAGQVSILAKHLHEGSLRHHWIYQRSVRHLLYSRTELSDDRMNENLRDVLVKVGANAGTINKQ